MQTRLSDLGDKRYQAWGKAFSTEVYPIGIDPDEITRNAKGPLPPKLAQLKNELKNVKNIFSVERLDYSKGLPERFLAYETLLEKYPQHHGKIRYTQIARRPPAAMCRPIRISATSWKPQPDASTDSLVSLAGHRSTI